MYKNTSIKLLLICQTTYGLSTLHIWLSYFKWKSLTWLLKSFNETVVCDYLKTLNTTRSIIVIIENLKHQVVDDCTTQTVIRVVGWFVSAKKNCGAQNLVCMINNKCTCSQYHLCAAQLMVCRVMCPCSTRLPLLVWLYSIFVKKISHVCYFCISSRHLFFYF